MTLAKKKPVVNAKHHALNQARVIDESNPCPGRTDAERKFITRRLDEIKDTLAYHLETLHKLGTQPHWLPDAVITPEIEARYIESQSIYEGSPRDDHGYIIGLHDQGIRATNRVRAATWYKNDDAELYMIALVIVSPLPCNEWGALPLTPTQWRLIIPEMIATHMHWKWVHAVHKYWSDPTYEVGGTFGWHLEKCKKLDRDDSILWTGQAIYAHVVRQYLHHAQKTSGIQCQS